MFCNYSIKYNVYLVSTKICCKVAFNDITRNKEFSKSTVKAPINIANTCPNYPKRQKDTTHTFVVSLLSNLDWSHTQCNASSIDLEQAYAWRVELQFKSSNSTDFSSSFSTCIIALIIALKLFSFYVCCFCSHCLL